MVVSQGGEWQKTDVGMLLASELYLECGKADKYPRRMKELIGRIQGKSSLSAPPGGAQSAGGAFISYCWVNSASAVAEGTKVAECLCCCDVWATPNSEHQPGSFRVSNQVAACFTRSRSVWG